MAEDVSIQVNGLVDLKAAFRDLEGKVPKELAAGFKQIAKDIVDDVKPKVPHRSGAAEASVKASGTQKGGSIKAGGPKAPYYQWLDFGGSVGRGHQARQSGSGAVKRQWLGPPSGKGRYIYPTIEAHRAATIKAVDELITGLAARAGFDVKGDL